MQRLERRRFDDVVRVLCAAFHDYPVMRYVLAEAGADYDRQLAQLIGYFTASRFARDWPVLGVEVDGRLVAAANVNPPRPAPPPPELQRRFEALRRDLGSRAIARFDAFAEACKPFEPAEPHYYLGMIGVLPDQQGCGHARRLLDAVHEMSAQDAASHGVVLTTESPANLPLYAHFGYRILGCVDVETLRTWTLFRADET